MQEEKEMIIKIGGQYGTVISDLADAVLFKLSHNALFCTGSSEVYTNLKLDKLRYPILLKGGATTSNGNTLWLIEERSDDLLKDLQRYLNDAEEQINRLRRTCADLREMFIDVFAEDRMHEMADEVFAKVKKLVNSKKKHKSKKK